MNDAPKMKQPIPIASAQAIAEQFGYHQVIVIARAIGDDGGEHLTTYGVNAPNCLAAARIGAGPSRRPCWAKIAATRR